MKEIRRLISFVFRASPFHVTLVYLQGALNSLVIVLIAWIGKFIIDTISYMINQRYFGGTPLIYLTLYIGIEAMLLVILNLNEIRASFNKEIVSRQWEMKANRSLVDSVYRLEYSQMEDSRFQDNVSMIQRELFYRPTLIVYSLSELFSGLAAVIITATLLLRFFPPVATLCVLAVLPQFSVRMFYSKRLLSLQQELEDKKRQKVYTAGLLTNLVTIKEVITLRLRHFLSKKYVSLFDEINERELNFHLRRDNRLLAMSFVHYVMMGAAYILTVKVGVMRDVYTIGTVVYYLSLCRLLNSNGERMLLALARIYEGRVFLKPFFDLESYAGHQAATPKIDRPLAIDKVEFRNVVFAYPGTQVTIFDNLSLTMCRGQRIAITGPNGTGKTTLVKLLLGLFCPQEGVVQINGKYQLSDIKDVELFKRIAVLHQDFNRYFYSFRQNLEVGAIEETLSQEDLDEHVRRLNVEPILKKLPDSYDTILGILFSAGRELSLGEWKRLAIARILIAKHADLVILDEPFAFLDKNSRSKLINALDEFNQNTMLLVISHEDLDLTDRFQRYRIEGKKLIPATKDS